MFVKQIILFAFFVSLFLGFSWKHPLPEKDKYIALATYLKEGKVRAKLMSLGGHSENCMSIELKNLSKDTVFLFLEPGRRLLASDTTMQDILIVKKEEVLLTPLASKKINGYGFCCESTNRSPKTGTSYAIGHMAPAFWVKVAEFISNNKFPSEALQSAVWVMSNDHDITSVYAQDEDAVRPLRKLLGEVKGVAVPWYSKTYEKDTDRVFSGKENYILGKIPYKLKNNAIVSIVVRDKWGTIAKTLVEEAAKGPGPQEYELELNVKGWGKGEYVITIMEDYSHVNTTFSFKIN
ncbi:MAG: hypothetical protein JWM14_2094 [Chitinophagaceae bacterium]|nr:hypothetical protein [Chitinophagaceae bacterium]